MAETKAPETDILLHFAVKDPVKFEQEYVTAAQAMGYKQSKIDATVECIRRGDSAASARALTVILALLVDEDELGLELRS